ncbi:MAG TPA: hypothetical protein VGM90_21075 [Kofleriaceae bacterium]
MTRAVLVVAALSSAAFADAKCKPAGAVIFQFDQLADKKAKLMTSKTRFYENGAYVTQSFDLHRTLARTDTRCVADERLAHFRELLAAATWKKTDVDAPCTEASPRYTEVRVGRTLVFVDRHCNAKQLDDDSDAALGDFMWIVHVPTMDNVRTTSDLDPRNYCSTNPLASGCAD